MHGNLQTTLRDDFNRRIVGAEVNANGKEVEVNVKMDDRMYRVLVEVFNGKLNIVAYTDGFDDPLTKVEVTALPLPEESDAD